MASYATFTLNGMMAVTKTVRRIGKTAKNRESTLRGMRTPRNAKKYTSTTKMTTTKDTHAYFGTKKVILC